ncbi:MAG: hypothetical protein U9O94_00880 [Nanoarchaeota archaeon]|nr:hypothetical protein [Nanoarchaeota archaeon]
MKSTSYGGVKIGENSLQGKSKLSSLVFVILIFLSLIATVFAVNEDAIPGAEYLSVMLNSLADSLNDAKDNQEKVNKAPVITDINIKVTPTQDDGGETHNPIASQNNGKISAPNTLVSEIEEEVTPIKDKGKKSTPSTISSQSGGQGPAPTPIVSSIAPHIWPIEEPVFDDRIKVRKSNLKYGKLNSSQINIFVKENGEWEKVEPDEEESDIIYYDKKVRSLSDVKIEINNEN